MRGGRGGAGAPARAVPALDSKQHKLSVLEKRLILRVHENLRSSGLVKRVGRGSSLADIMASLCSVGSRTVTRCLREFRDNGGVLRDPAPGGCPPFKIPSEVAGPLIRRYAATQRKNKQPVTVRGLQRRWQWLARAEDVSWDCLRRTMRRCGFYFSHPRTKRTLGHETLHNRAYRVKYLERMEKWGEDAMSARRRGGCMWLRGHLHAALCECLGRGAA